MFCKRCLYQLASLQANRCPECGEAFDPQDQTTFLKSAMHGALTAPLRTLIVVAAFGFWYLLTMGHASANTSWESHPFAGPFIIIKESLGQSHTLSDWAFALLFWAFFVSFPLHWIFTGRWWSAISAVVLCGATILFSCFAAVTASC